MKAPIFVILLALFPGMALCEPELKGSPEELQRYLLTDRSVVIILGIGEERAPADTAVVSLLVKTKEDKFKAALDRNMRVRNGIRERLVAAGIPTEKIDIARYSSTPSYGWFGDKPASYEIINEIKVALEKENHLLLIAEIVDSASEVRFITTRLENSVEEASRLRALDKSLEEVGAKKKLYEKRLGVTLSAVRVTEQSVHEEGLPVLQGVSAKGKSAPFLTHEADVSAGPSASFGEIVYKASTQVEFVIKQTPK